MKKEIYICDICKEEAGAPRVNDLKVMETTNEVDKRLLHKMIKEEIWTGHRLTDPQPFLDEVMNEFDKKFPYRLESVKHDGIGGASIVTDEIKSFLKEKIDHAYSMGRQNVRDEILEKMPEEDTYELCVNCGGKGRPVECCGLGQRFGVKNGFNLCRSQYWRF